MKTNRPLVFAILLCAILSLIGINTIAQTLTINGKITLNNESSFEMVKVSIVDLDTTNVQNTMTYDVVRGFEVELKDNKNYLIVVQKKGFQSKAIAVSTVTREKYYKYTFIVNLVDTEPVIDNPVFAGGIYYNRKTRNFDYYLSTAKKE